MKLPDVNYWITNMLETYDRVSDLNFTVGKPLQVETAGQLTLSSVIIPGGTRIEDLRLVEAARDQGIVDRVWLVGDAQSVLSGGTFGGRP